jgi:hypothetical protein
LSVTKNFFYEALIGREGGWELIKEINPFISITPSKLLMHVKNFDFREISKVTFVNTLMSSGPWLVAITFEQESAEKYGGFHKAGLRIF